MTLLKTFVFKVLVWIALHLAGFEVLTAVSMNTAVFWVAASVVWQEFTDVSEVITAIIIGAMEVASTCKVSKFLPDYTVQRP
jgi:vancomycin permeability regulator SanA